MNGSEGSSCFLRGIATLCTVSMDGGDGKALRPKTSARNTSTKAFGCERYIVPGKPVIQILLCLNLFS